MTARRLQLLSLVILAGGFCATGASAGCSCPAAGETRWESVAAAYRCADAIFEAEVLVSMPPAGGSAREAWTQPVYTLAVPRLYIGPVRGTVILRIDPARKTRWFRFEVGKKYLVYATADAQGQLHVDSCSRTRLLDALAAADLRYLRGDSPLPEDLVASRVEPRKKQEPRGRHKE